jgi:hypothetical protein
MVKSRLNKMHAEDMSSCRSKEEKKQVLTDLFEERMVQYKAILSSFERANARDK